MVAGHPRATTTSSEVADDTAWAIQPEERVPTSLGPTPQRHQSTQTLRWPSGSSDSMAVGETDPSYPELLEVSKEARSQAQVTPEEDRIHGVSLRGAGAMVLGCRPFCGLS